MTFQKKPIPERLIRKAADLAGLRIHVSPGNIKMGVIASISTRPVFDCARCKECRAQCYGLKSWFQYKETRAALTRNASLARFAPDSYWAQLDAYLTKRTPAYFRFHTTGDILDQAYLRRMYATARRHPETRFLCFTKRDDLNFSGRPSNMAIRLSQWPGRPVSRQRMPRAWMQDGTETRAPRSALPCSGRCDECAACWDSKLDVVIPLH